MARKQWAEAQSKLESAIQADPPGATPPIYSCLAECLYQRGRYGEALVQMRQVFFGRWRGFEEKSEAWVQYGRIAERAGQPEEAYHAYENAVLKAAKLNDDFAGSVPNNPTRQQVRALALVAAGQVFLRRDDGSEAIRSFKEAIRIDSRCGIAYFLLATTISAREGNTSETYSYLEKAARFSTGRLKQFAERRRVEVKSVVAP